MDKRIFRQSSICLSARLAIALFVLVTFTSNGQAQTKAQSWLAGTWEGTGYQLDAHETWTMTLRARGNQFLIEDPSLKCNGSWRLLDIDSRSARFREQITVGVSECANNGHVTIERLNRKQIAFRYSYSDTREISASAILNRRK